MSVQDQDFFIKVPLQQTENKTRASQVGWVDCNPNKHLGVIVKASPGFLVLNKHGCQRHLESSHIWCEQLHSNCFQAIQLMLSIRKSSQSPWQLILLVLTDLSFTAQTEWNTAS